MQKISKIQLEKICKKYAKKIFSIPQGLSQAKILLRLGHLVQFVMNIFPISPNSTMLVRCDRLFCCSLADLMAFLKMLLSLLTSFRLVLRFSYKYPSGPHFGGAAFYKPSFLACSSSIIYKKAILQFWQLVG